jgi:hypothetical protein
MIICGEKIKLTVDELDTLAKIVGEPVYPKTVDDYNLCLQCVIDEADSNIPEARLMAAVADRRLIRHGIPPTPDAD